MSELIRKILVSSSIFNKDTTYTAVEGFFSSLRGSANKLTFNDSIKASLGEFSERYTELSYPHNLNKVAALNIIDDKITFIEPNQVYLLRNNQLTSNKDFFDSSGTAFFTNPERALEKAFFEFIERQSLVYSFLRKWPGKKINKKIILAALKPYSKYNFSTIIMNDISVITGIHVILFIGINSNSYNVGLGTDYNLNSAIQNALAEGIGANIFEISNKEIIKRTYSLKLLDDNIKNGSLKVNSYEDIFFNLLTPKFILERFKYLETAPLQNNKERKITKKQTVDKIKDICKNWKLKPCISLLNGISNNIYDSIIHISADGAYPHIFTSFLKPEDYKASYLLNSSNYFPNKYKYLPFP